MQNKPESFWYMILYLIPIVGTIIVAVMFNDEDKRLKFHKYQSFVEGIVLIVLFIIGKILSAIILGQAFSPGASFNVASSAVGLNETVSLILGLISLLLWIYGLFVGFKASQGSDIKMILLGDITNKIMSA